MERKYYRHWAESELGEGTVYMEVEDEYVVRQVEKYGDAYFWSTVDAEKDPRFLIADQPVDVLDFDPSQQMPGEEFERIWRRAGGPRLARGHRMGEMTATDPVGTLLRLVRYRDKLIAEVQLVEEARIVEGTVLRAGDLVLEVTGLGSPGSPEEVAEGLVSLLLAPRSPEDVSSITEGARDLELYVEHQGEVDDDPNHEDDIK